MKGIPSNFKRFLIDFLGIVTFAVVLANLSLEGYISSLSDLIPVGRESDFRSSDFYQIVADARAEKYLDDKIVIVPIDTMSRKRICQLVEDISLCNPKVIGLDVFFSFPMEGDDYLLDVLRNTSGLVAAIGGIEDNKNVMVLNDSYILDSLPYSNRGIVNMNVRRRYHVVRDFIPYYQTNRGTINHFALAIAAQAAPEKAKCARDYYEYNNVPVPIYYPSREFEVIEPGEIIERIDDLDGKIVLIGALHDPQDIFVTPTNDTMPGIMVHAYALSTILSEQYMNTMSKCVLWFWGLLISILFISIKIWLKKRSLENLLMRIFQVLLMLSITYIGCLLFIEYRYVIELSIPLMLVALGVAALDVWDDFLHLLKNIYSYMKNHLFARLKVLLFLLSLSLTMQAASYRVYKFEGDVRILQADKWVKPQKNQELSVRDQFIIGEQGVLGIVVNETHRIYYNVQSGKQNVAQIISAARKQSDRLANNMHKQLTTNKKLGDSSFPVLGGVNRGNTQENNTAQVYAAIYQYLKSNVKQPIVPITAEIVYNGDNYHFKTVNHIDKPLYFNVIKLPIKSDDYPQICMEVGYTENEPFLVIDANKAIDWINYLFVIEESKHRYLIFASEVPYDCQALQIMLKMQQPPDISGNFATVYMSVIQ